MTAADAIKQWSEACAAVQAGSNAVIRDGNWQPIARALRHDADAKIVVAGELNGDTVIAVGPVDTDPPAGKSAMKRPPYLLIVK